MTDTTTPEQTQNTIADTPAKLSASYYAPLSQSYYRSLAFYTAEGINPLLSAAAPLIALNVRLKTKTDYHQITDLYQHLIHEVKAFESNAKKRGYRSETILIARYIICASIDETISSSPFGEVSGWQVNQLLGTFQTDDNVEERFFLILEKLMKDPIHHLDLLEFIYLALSLGFEGKYRREPFGKKAFDQLVDELYSHIKLHRKELPSFFLPLSRMTIPKTRLTKKPNQRRLLLVSGVIVIAIFLGFNISLGMKTQTLQHNLITLDHILKNYE